MARQPNKSFLAGAAANSKRAIIAHGTPRIGIPSARWATCPFSCVEMSGPCRLLLSIATFSLGPGGIVPPISGDQLVNSSYPN